MSIVTKTGDDGTTGLMYRRRVSKCHPRVEAYGAVDELNTALGLARAAGPPNGLGAQLLLIQKELVALMGELATLPEDRPRYIQDGYAAVTGEMTARLEKVVAEIEAKKIAFKGWATPGATLPAAALDLARTACRRAERRGWALREAGQLENMEILLYLNRLSDTLWLMARQAEQDPPPS
jgi:cob(I)alamin adenosyltransferase